MPATEPYPIGQPGRPWDDNDRAVWLAQQTVKRSYADDVVTKIEALRDGFQIEQYGELPNDPARYPLYVLSSQSPSPDLPTVLITGGVHGYETSGVHAALRFLETEAARFSDSFNFVVLPCVSPWGYETINRWNPGAVDPNRSFRSDSPAQEAAAVMRCLDGLGIEFLAHFDLHETTDTDNTEFRPALAARDGVEHDEWDIPDGFYAVADSARPAVEFHAAIIRAVEAVTHIAPATDGKLIGEPLQQPGVITYDAGPLGLCMGVTRAPYVTTTEVYPDSPRMTDAICIEAQLAAVSGGLGYLADAAGRGAG